MFDIITTAAIIAPGAAFFFILVGYTSGSRNAEVKFKQIIDSHARREQELKARLTKESQALQVLSGLHTKRERGLSKFHSLTGIDDSTLMQLSEAESNFDDYLSAKSAKVNKYIRKLMDLNLQRKASFESRPIVTSAGTKIAKIPLFSQTKEEFLLKEQLLCAEVAKEREIVVPITTSKTLCSIVKIIDGDTFDVQVGSDRIRIRTVGYDTPEVCHPKKGYGHWGIQASEAAERIVKSGSIFHVYLDTEGFKKRWTNDRYGRILAHLEVDGVLIGQTLLSEGHAELVDVFPIQESILSSYKKAEYTAKLENLGMWTDINRYESVPVHEQKKWNLADAVNNHLERDMVKSLMKDVLSDMLGRVFTKSTGSTVLHDENCHYVKTISNSVNIELSDELIESGNVRPCKRCNGDALAVELLKN